MHKSRPQSSLFLALVQQNHAKTGEEQFYGWARFTRLLDIERKNAPLGKSMYEMLIDTVMRRG